VFAKGVGHPDAVLLVNREVERPHERLAGFLTGTLANDLTPGHITLGEVDQLVLRDSESPYIAAGRDDDALH
jgi:hypothetical protein